MYKKKEGGGVERVRIHSFHFTLVKVKGMKQKETDERLGVLFLLSFLNTEMAHFSICIFIHYF